MRRKVSWKKAKSAAACECVLFSKVVQQKHTTIQLRTFSLLTNLLFAVYQKSKSPVPGPDKYEIW